MVSAECSARPSTTGSTLRLPPTTSCGPTTSAQRSSAYSNSLAPVRPSTSSAVSSQLALQFPTAPPLTATTPRHIGATSPRIAKANVRPHSSRTDGQSTGSQSARPASHQHQRWQAPSEVPTYTSSAADKRPGLGGRQGSKRFAMQQGLAVSGEAGQKAVARQELAKQLRAAELGSMRVHTMMGVQHPLSPRFSGFTDADGWRHLPHDPSQPVDLRAAVAQLEAQTLAAAAALTDKHSRPGSPSREATAGSPGHGGWQGDGAAAPGARPSTSAASFDRPTPRSMPLAPMPPLSDQLSGSLSAAIDAGTDADTPRGGGDAGMTPHHEASDADSFVRAAAMRTAQYREFHKGPLRRYRLDDLGHRSGATSPRPPSPPPTDLIHPGQFGPAPPRPKFTYQYLEPKEKATPLSARLKARRDASPPSSGDEEKSTLMLPEEECLRLFEAAGRLPPYKRVKERIRLLREQPMLQDAIAARAQQHRGAMQANRSNDFVAMNSNFGEADAAWRKRKVASRRKRQARTKAAQKIAAEGPQRDITLSSEALTRARALGRKRDLRRGWTAFVMAQEAQRARAWAMLVRMSRTVRTMRGITTLAHFVQKIKATSRVETAVRTMQRIFRERKLANENKLRMTQLTTIQRYVRMWRLRKKRREMGEAVEVLVTFLLGCSRLTPMEMAIKRFSTRVRVMQQFIRGHQAVTKGKLILLNLQWKRLENARLVTDYGHVRTPDAAGGGGREKRRSGDEHDKGKRVVPKGQYAGVPEDMLDLPLPHVPDEIRTKILKKLLSDLRRKYIEEQVRWDQKVLLKAEQHPALIGGERGVKRLATLQHEIAKDRSANRRTSKYSSVLAIFDNITRAEVERRHSDGMGDEEGGGGSPAMGASRSLLPMTPQSDGKRKPTPKEALLGKMKKLNTSLSEQRAALDEIRRSIPRPFVRILVPHAAMQAAFDKAVHECTMNGTFEGKPIRPVKVHRSTSPTPKSPLASPTPKPLARGQSHIGSQKDVLAHS